MTEPLAHEPYRETAAWMAGEAQALAEVAALPPDDGTASVSRDMGGGKDRDYYKLCRRCHNDRSSDRCTCRPPFDA